MTIPCSTPNTACTLMRELGWSGAASGVASFSNGSAALGNWRVGASLESAVASCFATSEVQPKRRPSFEATNREWSISSSQPVVPCTTDQLSSAAIEYTSRVSPPETRRRARSSTTNSALRGARHKCCCVTRKTCPPARGAETRLLCLLRCSSRRRGVFGRIFCPGAAGPGARADGAAAGKRGAVLRAAWAQRVAGLRLRRRPLRFS